jgi:hypothetical protein
MGVLRRLAEQRIVEAIERGEFDELPGAGRALDLGGDAYVPSELRAIYRVLKNSGYLPPELTLGNEIRAARRRVQEAATDDERAAAVRRLDSLRVKLESARGRPLSPALEAAYGERLLERLGGRRGGEQTGD